MCTFIVYLLSFNCCFIIFRYSIIISFQHLWWNCLVELFLSIVKSLIKSSTHDLHLVTGHYSPTEMATECDVCPAGTTCRYTGMNYTEPCPSGYYCPAGSFGDGQPCPQGTSTSCLCYVLSATVEHLLTSVLFRYI